LLQQKRHNGGDRHVSALIHVSAHPAPMPVQNEKNWSPKEHGSKTAVELPKPAAKRIAETANAAAAMNVMIRAD
jgi:hypothetical protein